MKQPARGGGPTADGPSMSPLPLLWLTVLSGTAASTAKNPDGEAGPVADPGPGWAAAPGLVPEDHDIHLGIATGLFLTSSERTLMAGGEPVAAGSAGLQFNLRFDYMPWAYLGIEGGGRPHCPGEPRERNARVVQTGRPRAPSVARTARAFFPVGGRGSRSDERCATARRDPPSGGALGHRHEVVPSARDPGSGGGSSPRRPRERGAGSAVRNPARSVFSTQLTGAFRSSRSIPKCSARGGSSRRDCRRSARGRTRNAPPSTDGCFVDFGPVRWRWSGRRWNPRTVRLRSSPRGRLSTRCPP